MFLHISITDAISTKLSYLLGTGYKKEEGGGKKNTKPIERGGFACRFLCDQSQDLVFFRAAARDGFFGFFVVYPYKIFQIDELHFFHYAPRKHR